MQAGTVAAMTASNTSREYVSNRADIVGEASMKLAREERSGDALIIFNRSSLGSLWKTSCEEARLRTGGGADEDVGDAGNMALATATGARRSRSCAHGNINGVNRPIVQSSRNLSSPFHSGIHGVREK
jgi:hypothetical protein